jgi:acyl-CoA reductase-like NAD-dependent aldehyde dehydrogenase
VNAPSAPWTLPAAVGAFIDGQPCAGNGPRVDIVDPCLGAPISAFDESDAAQVDAAVAAARAAFERGSWPRASVQRRQAVLRDIQAVLLRHVDELAWLECRNTGIVLRELRQRHLPRAASNFGFFADHIGHSAGQVYRQTPGYVSTVMREPAGVAALISPWNAPLALSSMQIASAIAFGATCVIKPSEQSPLAVMRMVELMHEAGLPPGVVNLVNGRGPVTGQALVAHPDVRRVCFTGGTETGRRIMETAARHLAPCTLELGGKSANIVFASADLDRALDGALLGIFSNNGQQCLAGSRILVQRRIFDDFVERFVARARGLRIGHPMDDTTELGPLASSAQLQRVLRYAAHARDDGCTLLTGGAAVSRLSPGFYAEPTAVIAPDNRCRVAQDEIFGPFATLMAFDDVDDALTLANDSRFGLVSYVWSDHLPTVTAMTEGLRTGIVWVNTPMMRELRAPFGGYKDSGVGRQSGDACEAFFTEEKVVTIPTTPPLLRRLGQGA